jgi:hypothetical protein
VQLGVPLLLCVLEERHMMERADGGATAYVSTNLVAPGITPTIAEAMIATLLKYAIHSVEEKACDCPICEKRIGRLQAALGIFEQEHERMRRRAI